MSPERPEEAPEFSPLAPAGQGGSGRGEGENRRASEVSRCAALATRHQVYTERGRLAPLAGLSVSACQHTAGKVLLIHVFP